MRWYVYLNILLNIYVFIYTFLKIYKFIVYNIFFKKNYSKMQNKGKYKGSLTIYIYIYKRELGWKTQTPNWGAKRATRVQTSSLCTNSRMNIDNFVTSLTRTIHQVILRPNCWILSLLVFLNLQGALEMLNHAIAFAESDST